MGIGNPQYMVAFIGSGPPCTCWPFLQHQGARGLQRGRYIDWRPWSVGASCPRSHSRSADPRQPSTTAGASGATVYSEFPEVLAGDRMVSPCPHSPRLPKITGLAINERKRKIAVKCVELEEMLERQG